jgi:c-di-GMP-related signal transduction protein
MATNQALAAPSPAFAPGIFLGRQPIYDPALNVSAYELVYGTAARADAEPNDDDAARLLDALAEIGLDTLVGSRQAFVRLPRAALAGDLGRVFAPDRLVPQIAAGIETDAAIDSLRQRGYRVALREVPTDLGFERLVDLVDIVDVDVRAMGPQTLRTRVEALRAHRVRLLARNVESHEQFETCTELGFDLLHGPFISVPRSVVGRPAQSNRLVGLELVARLLDPEVDIRSLEALIAQDLTLSYNLLRLVNSASYGLRRRVESLHEAVVLLGTNEVSRWVSLMLLNGVEDKPPELFATAMIRGRMCELLAAALGRPDGDQYFTAGLFSTLDALMDSPMLSVLAPLRLGADLTAALLRQEGPIGEVLRCVLAYERADWRDVRCAQLDDATVVTAQVEAITWATAAALDLAGATD